MCRCDGQVRFQLACAAHLYSIFLSIDIYRQKRKAFETEEGTSSVGLEPTLDA
jgi:hypothetical protein